MSASTTPESTRSIPATDPTLVAAYRRGDERAAAELIERHSAALGRFLYSAGANREDLDDLVQETLFRAFLRLATWRAEASFRSWLFTIGNNLLRDHFRSRKGHQLLSIEDRDIPDSRDPHADLAAVEAEERLRQDGSEYEEIALVLGTTPGAARVHYHHAVKRLKELVR